MGTSMDSIDSTGGPIVFDQLLSRGNTSKPQENHGADYPFSRVNSGNSMDSMISTGGPINFGQILGNNESTDDIRLQQDEMPGQDQVKSSQKVSGKVVITLTTILGKKRKWDNLRMQLYHKRHFMV